jgi:hypothetical protein
MGIPTYYCHCRRIDPWNYPQVKKKEKCLYKYHYFMPSQPQNDTSQLPLKFGMHPISPPGEEGIILIHEMLGLGCKVLLKLPGKII